MDTPEGKSPIRKSVRVLSPATKTNKGKSSRKSLEFVQERLHASEKENNDNIDQYLNIDNLPEGGLQVKVVFKTEPENVLVRIPRDEMTKAPFSNFSLISPLVKENLPTVHTSKFSLTSFP